MNAKILPQLDFPLVVLNGGKTARNLVSAETQARYAKVLGKISSSSILDDIFIIDGIPNHDTAKFNFSKYALPHEETMLLKCFSLHGLCIVSPSTCLRHLSNLQHLFKYLTEAKTQIEALSTTRLAMLTGWLDKKDFTAEKKNDIANSVERLVDFMKMLGLLRAGLVVFEHRWKTEHKEPVRAPERQVIEQLDLHFFDMENDVPSDIRCCYMTLRLISNRIDEVLKMPLEAIKYYHDDVFIVCIPNQKGQSLCIPCVDEYAMCIDGDAERIFLEALCLQQEYARSVQDCLADDAKDKLFASTENPGKLLSESKFNTYLGDICEKLQLTDSEDTPVRLTSHALRHFNIAMRYADGRFLPQWIRREANHRSEAASMGYSYPSKAEERKRFAAIQDYLAPQTSICPIELSERKYHQLSQNPATRILPGQGLCNSSTCRMQLERCVHCEHFEANPEYTPAFVEACEQVKAQIEVASSDEQRKQLKKRLATYKRFLRLAKLE